MRKHTHPEYTTAETLTILGVTRQTLYNWGLAQDASGSPVGLWFSRELIAEAAATKGIIPNWDAVPDPRPGRRWESHDLWRRVRELHDDLDVLHQRVREVDQTDCSYRFALDDAVDALSDLIAEADL